MTHFQHNNHHSSKKAWSVLQPAWLAKPWAIRAYSYPSSHILLTPLSAFLLLGLLLQPKAGQAQGRPKQYQIPTTFDSVYTKRPARLAYFIAWEYYGGGQIEWVTLREGKIAAFAVQCSLDGHSWQPVGGTMEAKPGSREQRNYTLYDNNIRRYGVPVLYYRVQEIARNGHVTYSPVRSIRVSNSPTLWTTPATQSGVPNSSLTEKL